MPGWRRFICRKGELRLAGAVLLAAACVLAAVGMRMLLGLIGITLTFPTFYPAVLLAALIGGRIAGLLSIALSIMAAWYIVIDPPFEFTPLTRTMIANFVVFALSDLVIVVLAATHRRLLFDVEDHERERSLLIREVEHRSRNVVSVVDAIVRQTIADQELGRTLIERVRAAADAEDLLTAATANPAGLRDLLATVLRPYGSRTLLTGPEVMLNGRQARNLRLVFHELMPLNTGAVGAAWPNRDSMASRRWLDWREIDGPKVTQPKRHNFGSKLIVGMLRQIGAELTPDFAETGHCYRIVIPSGDLRRPRSSPN